MPLKVMYKQYEPNAHMLWTDTLNASSEYHKLNATKSHVQK